MEINLKHFKHMTTAFNFIVSFDEFVSNIDELLNEAYNNSKIPDDIINAVNDDFDTIFKNIINDIESNKFDKISYRNILTNYFKKVEIVRDHIKSKMLYDEYAFLNSLVDCWNDFAIEIDANK